MLKKILVRKIPLTGLLLLALAGLTLGWGYLARAEVLTEKETQYLRNKDTILFISQTNYPPFEFVDQDGNSAGMCIELAKWIATTFGFKARFANVSFQEAQRAVLSGKADVITSLFFSPKRAQKFGFTKVIFKVPASIFVAADRPDIKSIVDLNGKTIAMQQGDYAQEFLESQNIRFKVAWTKNFAEATDLVIAGKADAVIGDEQIVLYHVYSHQKTAYIKKVGKPLYIGRNCMAVKAGNPILQSILNKGVALAKSTGTLDQINRKWLGMRYGRHDSLLVRYWPYLLSGAGLILLLTLVVWIWNFQLRSLVGKRTKALARSEGLLRTVLAASPVGIGLVYNRVSLGWHNQAMSDMLGYNSVEMKGELAPKLYPSKEEYHRVGRAIQKGIDETGTAKVETRWVRKDGSVFDCLLRYAPLEIGGEDITAIIIAEDISERKQAEAALKENQERMQAIMAANPHPMVVYDRQGRTLFLNPAFTKVFGWSLEETRGKRIPFVPQPEEAATMRLIDELYQTGRPVTTATQRLTKDGKLLEVMISAAAVQDAEGRSVGMVVNLQDVTESKKLEAQLRQAQKMEAIGILAGGIAHDFNNILAAVIGYAELAETTAQKGKDNSAMLAKILEAAERARRLIRQILAFSRKVPMELKPLDLNHEVMEAVKILERTIPKMIRIETRLASDARLINADSTQIHQVLLNLVTNAADAMPEGGRILLETTNVTLDELFQREHPEVHPGDYVLLQVSDTGTGMDPDTVEKAFDPFFTTKEVGEGTGLGLATVHGIIKQSQGHIFCYSEPGQGTVFKLYFPTLVEQVDFPAEAKRAPGKIQGGSETILLVDDEEALCHLGSQALRSMGYQVLTAKSGEEALQLYHDKGELIDLVIMDLGMPGMGGHQCLQAILAQDSEARVIIASGYSANGQVRASLQAGAHGFIAKPFRRADLLAKVREVLDGDQAPPA